MKLNPINWLLDDDRNKNLPVLLAVTPPRTGERTLLGVENLLGSIAVPEPFSLELAGDMDGVTLLARCLDKEAVRGQISAHYPQALIREVPREEDPLRLEEGERAWSMTLRADGPEYAPLRTFRDDDLLDPGSDPLIALLGALSALKEGERVVARLLLRSLGPDWSEAHMEKAHKRPGMEPREPAYTYQTKPLQTDGITMAVLGVAALAAIKGYLWVQAGETWKAALLGTGIALGLAVGGFAWHRWKKARSRVYDPILIKEKVSRIAFDAELQVTAVLPPEAGPKRAKELLDPVAAAYRHYDNPAGARLKVGTARPALPTDNLHSAGPGLFGKRSVLGVREVAALWHPPGAGDETPLVERSGARVLLPSARGVRSGAHVGEATAGKRRDIHFPDDLLRRHHLYVARTRMGKSTLMHHIVVHKMRETRTGGQRRLGTQQTCYRVSFLPTTPVDRSHSLLKTAHHSRPSSAPFPAQSSLRTTALDGCTNSGSRRGKRRSAVVGERSRSSTWPPTRSSSRKTTWCGSCWRTRSAHGGPHGILIVHW